MEGEPWEMKRKGKNYLDFIPAHTPSLQYEVKEDGQVTLLAEWKGFYYWIAQKFFHRPKISRIDLDREGSFVWLAIDGKRDVFEIFNLVSLEFGEMDKGMSRLIKFLEILKNNRFIVWEKK